MNVQEFTDEVEKKNFRAIWLISIYTSQSYVRIIKIYTVRGTIYNAMVEQKSKTMYKKDISGSNQFYSANGNTRSVLQTKPMEKISLLQQLA